MERESGYYWVRSGRHWVIAEYFSATKNFFLVGLNTTYKEKDFTEIDETKIERSSPANKH